MIVAELENLLANVSGNAKKVEWIISVFIKETPGLFQEIEESICSGKLMEAAELIHKIKTRYGYIGLDLVMEELTAWENDLRANKPIDHTTLINHFNEVNANVMSELKETPFYKPEETLLSKLTLTGKQIIVAEDDEINAMVFKLLIKETGASVIIAKDGNQAMMLARAISPDLILMDVHMPFLSGIEVIKQLRSSGVHCPIILLSASTRLNERQNSLDAGANEFLIKPANREAINKVLMKYLN